MSGWSKIIRRNPTKVAQDVACIAMPELKTLAEFASKLQSETFMSGVPQTLHSFMLVQLSYIHDMIGILAATGGADRDSAMSVMARIAFDPVFNWVDYVNTLNKGLGLAKEWTRTTVELVEIERLTNLLVQSAHAVMPLREKLASELRKAGVVWK